MKAKERKVILAICVYAICVILTFLIVPKRMVCDICGRTFTGAYVEYNGEYTCSDCMRQWAWLAPDDLKRGNSNVVRNILLVVETLGIVAYVFSQYKSRTEDDTSRKEPKGIKRTEYPSAVAAERSSAPSTSSMPVKIILSSDSTNCVEPEVELSTCETEEHDTEETSRIKSTMRRSSSGVDNVYSSEKNGSHNSWFNRGGDL